ncbi:MAG TPA: DUF3108 domain-containing protein [Steroidobacteraceae bacterium]|nr:DUF3108 domain-containing protein [Steroidobacteraceae bacterium]
MRRRSDWRHVRLLWLLVTCVLSLLAASVAAADELRPFTATYDWIWKGMTVAETTVKLEKNADGTWTYSSNSSPRGIGKLAPQRPKTVSVLKVTAHGVQPLSYKGDDGTGSSAKAVDVTYDWNARHIAGVYEGAIVDLALKPDVQDDSSVQIALMAALLQGRTPDRFAVLDKNNVREYQYRKEGEETLKTAIGEVPTVIFASQRANSPHVNRYWLAPDRGYIPMRVQQKRGDDVQWTMEIRSLERQ